MNSKIKAEIINNICNQLVKFNNLVYGCNRGVDENMEEVFKKVVAVVNAAENHDLDDFDLWVFVSQTEGRILSRTQITRIQPAVSLVNAICDGIKLPKNTSFVRIQIKPVFKKGYNFHVAHLPIYEIKFGVGKEENLTMVQLHRRYGLNPDDNLFSQEDLASEGFFVFYDKQKHKSFDL